ncbi:hypothetical protein [Thiomicrorhabdus sp. Milos-T2]|uniref:hypothetical protein n=1 Tax=Thiomicrorhabdus sp. Milos-T2 TaxID=90814 RepID=UPI000494A4B7|nr:hypothetical protein [Thiomicrorhabdus sp. Milos-T2]
MICYGTNVDGIASKQKTTRYSFEVGRTSGNWRYYLDATWADSSTKGNINNMIAPYDGPGWIYAEYLIQNRYGDVVSDKYMSLVLFIFLWIGITNTYFLFLTSYFLEILFYKTSINWF